jgi:hypothetical protein
MPIYVEQDSLTGAARPERNRDAREAEFDVTRLEPAIAHYLVLAVTLDLPVQAQPAYYPLQYT